MPDQAVMDPPEAPVKEKTAQEKNAEYNAKKAARKKQMHVMQKQADTATIYMVKYIGGETFIKYSFIENDRNNTNLLKSDDEPTDTFRHALQALAPYASAIINHSTGEQQYQVSQLDIKGISLKYFEEGKIHVGINIVRTLDNGKAMNLNIPQMPLYPEDEHQSGYTKEAAEAIQEVLTQTRLFLGGRRANGNLFSKLED